MRNVLKGVAVGAVIMVTLTGVFLLLFCGVVFLDHAMRHLDSWLTLHWK